MTEPRRKGPSARIPFSSGVLRRSAEMHRPSESSLQCVRSGGRYLLPVSFVVPRAAPDARQGVGRSTHADYLPRVCGGLDIEIARLE